MNDPSVETEQLRAISREMSLPRLVMYAGATWDWHRLHYDNDFASRAKLPGPIVDGQLFGALLAEQILDHFGSSARIREMEFRFRSMVYAGETADVTGIVVRREPAGTADMITCEQTVTVGSRTCVTGTTTLLLTSTEEGR